MTSIHAKSKTCFVFSDGDGGFVVKMCMPDGRPLEHELDLARAAELQRQLSDAIAQMVRSPPPGQPEKYFQK